MLTVCMTYFKSLSLANLNAAAHSIRMQKDLSVVDQLIIVDNDTDDDVSDIRAAIDMMLFPMPVRLVSYKHHNSKWTHAWSTNRALELVTTPWVLFTRADYLLEFDALSKMTQAVADFNNVFVTGNVYHLHIPIDECEKTPWREVGLRAALRPLPGVEESYTVIDTGVWLARREAFELVGGLDERLTAWGHAQTHFQWKMHTAGVEFIRIPEPLFYHPFHSGERDITVAHAQLSECGVDIKELWKRYEGEQPYK